MDFMTVLSFFRYGNINMISIKTNKCILEKKKKEGILSHIAKMLILYNRRFDEKLFNDRNGNKTTACLSVMSRISIG